ncbi:hypothetical protein ABFA07_013672 [Porites harrisoni]
MASSSESSDEDLEKFAAIAGIVDTEVSKKCNSDNSRGSSKPHTRPSLRHWREDEDTASSTSELITPEFRQHVAKKLSNFLDSSYICAQEAEQNGCHNNSHKSSGIKLLLTSSQRLREESVQEISTTNKTKKNRKNCSSSSESDTDEEEMNRLAEAAVSGHSIIKNVSTGNHKGTETDDETTENSSVKGKKEKKRKKEKKKQRLETETEHKKKHKKRKKYKLKEET